MAIESHLRCCLGEVKSLDDRDSPDSAICMRKFAQARSSKMKRAHVIIEYKGVGIKANSGSSNGA